MRRVPGTKIWIPNYETEYLRLRESGKAPLHKYQEDRLISAYKICPKFDYAVDIGANIGLISMQMQNQFKMIFAFEPDHSSYECLVRNTEMKGGIQYFKCGCGAEETTGKMQSDMRSCGNNFIVPGIGIDIRPLDSFNLPGCDLLKIDTEGYEYFVIKGALQTILKYKPVIILEERLLWQKEKGKFKTGPSFEQFPDIPHHAARRILEDNGYGIYEKLTHDYVMGYIGTTKVRQKGNYVAVHPFPDSELPALDDELL